ncbi:DNA recombination protein RmuC [hydrothermal vent metagenome]|uniref:DNA recombination protein RmuC n=1 Tax=hydrothermal vent metagenome TaxID=652676 RepID=A0A3B0TB83_9ZZZZ
MDNIIFFVGGYGITFGLAILLAAISVALALIALVFVVVRNGGQRVEEAAQVASESLRINFTQQIADKDARLRDMEMETARLRRENSSLGAQVASLRVQMQEQEKQNQYVRSQMADQFKLLAGDVLKSHGETFSKQNRQQVEDLLKPLNEKIIQFQTGLARDRAELGERIRVLSEDSLRMSTEANNLTRALKGSSQAQGAWGEMILSSILERSGLREGEQFLTQQSHAGQDGSRIRTDVEVLFPNKDRLVVDSKVSLLAFEAMTNASDDDERARHLKDHIASLKSHIKTLGSKDYQIHTKSGLDFVMMFVPIEAAFSVALKEQSDLIDYAIGQNVYIATPTTLMVALRTVSNVWDIEKRHQNAEKIAERAGELFNKVTGFLGNMDRLGKNLGAAQRSFDDAKGQLVSGRGSVVRQIEMLEKLGAKTARKIPPGWQDDQDNSDDDREASAVPDQLTSPDPDVNGNED